MGMVMATDTQVMALSSNRSLKFGEVMAVGKDTTEEDNLCIPTILLSLVKL